jgi:hypothetical protein
MNAIMQRLHGRSSRELFSELVAAVDGLPGAIDTIGHLLADNDGLALERLERIAEYFAGLQRQAMLARAALANERHSPEAA